MSALRVAVLGSTGGVHAARLERALTARGHACVFAAVTRMAATACPGGLALRSAETDLAGCDAVIVRGIPRGSLEQVVFRLDALRALEAQGVLVVNAPAAIERTVDKLLTSALLVQAGVPTPRTIACERREDAIAAFAELGGDVVVKPLFGSMGRGLVRVDDPDVAHRVFAALDVERAVFYLQETVPHDGSDVRALVLGGRVIAAIERRGSDWRTNLARGASASATTLGTEYEALCVRAAAVAGAEIAGVDLVRGPDGHDVILEVNGIPGWTGVEDATGVDVAAALVARIETLVGAGS